MNSHYIKKKRPLWHVRPTETKISMRIRAVWSECSLSAWRNFASLAIQNVRSEDSDQTTRMRRLLWIFAGRTCPKVRFLTLRLKWPVLNICETWALTAELEKRIQIFQMLPQSIKHNCWISRTCLGFANKILFCSVLFQKENFYIHVQ